MCKRGLRIYLFLLIALFVGCSAEPVEVAPEIIPTATIELVAEELQPTALPTSTSLPVIPTFAPGRETAVTPTTPPAETPIPQPPTQLRDCPTVLPADALPLLSSGSLLYITGQTDETNLYFFAMKEHSDVLAFSADSLIPVPIYTIPSNLIRVTISPDGTKLLRFERAEERPDNYLYHAVVYDLVTKEETYSDQLLPQISGNWLPDGRIVSSIVNLERQVGVGEHHEFFILDMATQITETVSLDLDLPHYTYYEEPLYQGIASVDPSVQKVLYTTGGFNVVLRDLTTETNIWHYDGTYGLYPFPEWSSDGSKVFFSIPIEEGEHSYYKIFRLTRDGQEEKLPLQPYPGLDTEEVRYLNFSLDEQYIHYALQESFMTGAGYVLDIPGAWIGEICSGDGEFIEGQWIADGQFVYTVLLKNGGQSLHLLDVPTWTSQKLAQLPPGEGFVVYGWTPLELTSP